MADHTAIEWTDATWNPVTGCSVVSPGCTNCYAMKLAGTRLRHTQSRAGLTRETNAGPVWNGLVRFNEQWLEQPLRWRRPRRIFVCAHGDLFHESVPDDWIDRVFAVMALAPQHSFQVLTKRAERMHSYLTGHAAGGRHVWPAAQAITMPGRRHKADTRWPLPNVWLGVSVEDQKRAEERIPLLLRTPAAVRWLSCEPLLGAVDLTLDGLVCGPCPRCIDRGPDRETNVVECRACDCTGKGDEWEIDWVVAGGESSPDARPMHPDWARELRDQCVAAGVPFFFKQWGAWRPICEGASDWYDSLYRSNVKARDGDDQAAVDESCGRTCTVPETILHHDGSRHDFREPMAFLQGTRAMHIFNVGKKSAGRELDGRTWDEYPAS